MEKTKDIVVVARGGYQVLLNVGASILDISCYKSINLSKMFQEEILKTCTSLHSHLEDGNLVYYEGDKLPEDPTAPVIAKLNAATVSQIETNYTQSSDNPRMNDKISTDTGIIPQMKKDIQAGVAKTKAEAAQEGKEQVKKHTQREGVTPKSVEYPGRDSAIPPEKLKLAVTMDVSPEKFKEMQKNKHKALIAKDEKRVVQEIDAAVNNSID